MKLNKTKRQIGVFITLYSLLLIVLTFEYGISTQWNTVLIISEIILIVIFIISFAITFIKTGLWNFTHKRLEILDEREIALTSKSLRYAYAILTVFILLLLLSFSLIDKTFNIVTVVALIVFAHILPASIIAWTEKRVELE